MPRVPLMTTPFTSPGLVAAVLSNPVFANRGYVWGFDGSVHYCFYNPNKIRYEIWKKEWHILPFVGVAAGAALGWFLGGIIGAGIGTFATLFIPFLLYKHYYATAEEQKAAVFTNGPQMELPYNMSFETVLSLTALILAVPALAGGIIGGLAGTITLPYIGSVSGLLVGLVAGFVTAVNLFAIFMFLLGYGAKPYGSVLTPSFNEPRVPPVGFTAFLHRAAASTAFSAYSINLNNPPAAWGSGGLIPIIIARTSASSIGGQITKSYEDLVGNPRELVVWGLIPLTTEISSKWYDGHSDGNSEPPSSPPEGIIVVAGSLAWINAYTNALLTHGACDAVATDGSQSALLGSSGESVIGAAWNPLNIGSYRDQIQRYGFMAVPD